MYLPCFDEEEQEALQKKEKCNELGKNGTSF